jgi:hypothetical protein
MVFGFGAVLLALDEFDLYSIERVAVVFDKGEKLEC